MKWIMRMIKTVCLDICNLVCNNKKAVFYSFLFVFIYILFLFRTGYINFSEEFDLPTFDHALSLFQAIGSILIVVALLISYKTLQRQKYDSDRNIAELSKQTKSYTLQNIQTVFYKQIDFYKRSLGKKIDEPIAQELSAKIGYKGSKMQLCLVAVEEYLSLTYAGSATESLLEIKEDEQSLLHKLFHELLTSEWLETMKLKIRDRKEVILELLKYDELILNTLFPIRSMLAIIVSNEEIMDYHIRYSMIDILFYDIEYKLILLFLLAYILYFQVNESWRNDVVQYVYYSFGYRRRSEYESISRYIEDYIEVIP